MKQVCFDPVVKTSCAVSRRLALCLVSAFMSVPAWAQTAAAPNAGPNDAIFMNKAPDREAWLLERARKEGAVTLYTSLAPTESAPLMAEFEKNTASKSLSGVA